MPYYLVQVAYTPEAAATLIRNPQNRIEAVRPVLERLGGRVEGAWLMLGDYDVMLIADLPDTVSATAFSMASLAGGALRDCKTTALLTVEEGMEAARKAGQAGYQPPTG